MPTTTARARAQASQSAAEPSLAEHVCLALIVLGISHGWALGAELSPAGEIGRVWTLSRALTYRAVDGLVDKGLVVRQGQTPGHGRDRVVIAPTATGRRVAKRWLDKPVEHLRDVRTELLVKVLVRTRVGLDNSGFLAAQQSLFEPTIDVLTSTSGDDDLVDVWRRESARAVRRFLEHALHPVEPYAKAKPELRLSARNQLRGTVTAVHHGEVMSTVNAVLADGQPLTAAITKDAATDLDLAPGDAVVMVIKSTEIMVAKAS